MYVNLCLNIKMPSPPDLGRHSSIAIAMLLLSLAAPAAPFLPGQEVEVTAVASADTVGVQDQFQLTIRITGPNVGEVSPPVLPRFEGLEVVAGPSISTQYQWINGRTRYTRSFIYILLPEREGQFTIPPIEVEVQGKRYRTGPINLRVTSAGAAPRSGRTTPLDPFGDPALEPPRQHPTGDEVFVAAEVDPTKAYVGQQVTLAYYLYTRVSVTGLQLQESPTLNGFWVEDLEVDPNPSGVRRTVNGREFMVYLVKKQALFPTAAGKLHVPPATFAVSTRSEGSLFGWLGQAETLFRKTREIAVTVEPLPESGRPPDFGNAVGDFTIGSRLDKEEAGTGDAVTLEVKLAGRGNIKTIPDIELPALPDFTVFSSKRQDNVSPSADGQIGGEKVWEYVLVPKVPGAHSIPSIAFSYFNPREEVYRTVAAPALNLRVLRGDAGRDVLTDIPRLGRQNLTRQGTDISFIKLAADDLSPGAVSPLRPVLLYLLAGLSVALNMGIFLHQHHRASQLENAALLRRRRARASALARLKSALRDGKREPRRFYDGAARALAAYLEDRFGLPGIAVTRDTLERELSERGVGLDSIREAAACVEECDFGRFVAASPTPGKMTALSDRIRKVIEALEHT